ncbi:MAG TPA: replication-relaxation family protein [Gemmatimonadaceae bacterium]|nr:replication-relaxation family protein [Gemmatimonadaceae bacterium]
MPGPGRDDEVLHQIATRRFLTRLQLQELLHADSTLTPRSRAVVTWRVLGRLQRLGFVAATTRNAGGVPAGSSAPAYYLTTPGMRRVALSLRDLPRRRPAARGTFLLAHSLLANEIELSFRRTARAATDEELQLWESDWQIAMRLGEGASIVPDARLVYRCGQKRLHAFLEVDVGTEGTRYFAKKIPRYLDLYRSSAWRTFIPVWPLVLTVTPTDTRAQSLCSATYAALRYEYARPQTGSTFRFI